MGWWPRNKEEWRETAKSFLQNMVIVMGLLTFVIRGYTIPSSSMENTLKPGDRIFVAKFSYGWRIPFTKVRLGHWWTPHRKDIMVFRAPHEPQKDYIKRCIGLPGESLEIQDRTVRLNGNALEEPYTKYYEGAMPRGSFQADPSPIPSDSYFMMGDNRDNSKDSRFWGYLPMENVKGRALLIYWPLNRITWLK